MNVSKLADRPYAIPMLRSDYEIIEALLRRFTGLSEAVGYEALFATPSEREVVRNACERARSRRRYLDLPRDPNLDDIEKAMGHAT